MTKLLTKALAHLSQLPETKQDEIAFLILYEVGLLEDEPTPEHLTGETGDSFTEPFVGIWKDRFDLEDSTLFVRQLRQQEWK